MFRLNHNITTKMAGNCDGNEKGSADRSLDKFILEHYEQQKAAGKLDATEELDAERTQNFFARALGESRRMNDEVIKSQQKQEKLHEELGGDRLAKWRNEHATETLLPEQAERIRVAHQYC